MYVCDGCSRVEGVTKVEVDHIDPVVPLHRLSRDMTWDEIINRMFNCPDTNLQVLCKACHHTKTQAENAKRKGYQMQTTDPQKVAAEIVAEYKRLWLKNEDRDMITLIAHCFSKFVRKQEEAPACKKHPKLKGVRKPTNNCEGCWAFYLWKKQEKDN